MPPNLFLRAGAGDAYQLADRCPVASEKYGNGNYMSHQGDPDSFLVAEARVKDGSAAVRVAVWACVHCRAILVGLGAPEGIPDKQDYTWLERADD